MRRIKRQQAGNPIAYLARTLYEAMERLDPSTSPDVVTQKWNEMDAFSREFYISCIESLLVERAHILAALANDDVIVGRPKQTE